jgi:hypothetical protein
MGIDLRVTTEGLSALAGTCDALAGTLRSTTAQAGNTTYPQASAIAVGTCDGRIAVAATALETWMTAAAATFSAVAIAYERGDSESAGGLAAMVT